MRVAGVAGESAVVCDATSGSDRSVRASPAFGSRLWVSAGGGSAPRDSTGSETGSGATACRGGNGICVCAVFDAIATGFRSTSISTTLGSTRAMADARPPIAIPLDRISAPK
jgi:hypothetical protein